VTTVSMGDRFRQYEQATQFTLPRRTYTIMRLDGRGFSLFMRGKALPEEKFMRVMDLTAEMLCAEISGSVLAYTQSDEISILIQDFANLNTQPWFGGNIQKMTSVAAGMASHHFHAVYNQPGGSLRHTFDARVFTLSDPVEVANYFVWRQKDCTRNAIGSLYTKHYGHAAAQDCTTQQRLDRLKEDGMVDLEHFYQQRFLLGRLTTYDEKCLEESNSTWTRWSSGTAFRFTVAELEPFILTMTLSRS